MKIMDNFKIKALIILFFLVGCARSSINTRINKSRVIYRLSDKSGEYLLSRERGIVKSKSELIVKRKLEQDGKVFEKSVTISTLGNYKKKLPVLRPKRSQYTVWFDGKKYLTDMELNPKDKLLEIKMVSPEPQWNGTKRVAFPEGGKGIFCFFSQVFECALYSGFVKKAIKNDSGKMNLFVIWEGHPYFQEQYLNVSDNVFSKAIFSYDGVNSKGEKRFTLRADGQSIFYLVEEDRLDGIFWVAQGLSIIREKKL